MVGPRLSKLLHERSPERSWERDLDVVVIPRHDTLETMQLRVYRAIAEGLIETVGEYNLVRAELMESKRQEVEAITTPVTEFLRERGVSQIEYTHYSPSITATVSADDVAALKASGFLQLIDLNRSETLAGATLNGEEKSQVYQTYQYWDEQTDGENGDWHDTFWPGNDVTFAVMDYDGFRDTHKAFNDTSFSSSRIRGKWSCTSFLCAPLGVNDYIGPHGTATLGAIFDDWRDNQISGTTNLEEEQRSAPAGESRGYLYKPWQEAPAYRRTYDHAASRNPKPNIFVSSQGFPISGCNGTDASDVNADEALYENGVAFFTLAGNHGALGSTSKCSVWDPGASIGAFTVGGYDDPASDTVCDWRTRGPAPESSWGGSEMVHSEGRFRSVIDIMGAYRANGTAATANDTAWGAFSGTSHATPSVASAALAFIDNYKQNLSDYIDNPGSLYTWMLLMGDRANRYGWKNVAKYDHRTGAGQLKMRSLSAAGLDAPAIIYNYEVCVGDGQTVKLDIGGYLSSDFESITATAWWYDSNFHSSACASNTACVDDIDLRLYDESGPTLLRSSADGYDNKERVYYKDMGGRDLELWLVGSDVTSDSEGCGTNSMRVFVSVLAEDDDRDDTDGPTYNTSTCEGVEPQ